MIKIVSYLCISGLILFSSCNKQHVETDRVAISDEALLDSVQRRTSNYFLDGAEVNSGMARERYHVDEEDLISENTIITSGGSGFGVMAIIAAIEREYITKKDGFERLNKIVSFVETADNFHGAFPHWWEGKSGRVKAFSQKDNGGDLVETAFLIQGLLALHQYYVDGTEEERALSARVDQIWRNVDWDWYRNGQDVLYWHWSPDYGWKMNFPVRGFNECLIMYVLAAASPTHSISKEVYEKGWCESGAISDRHETEGVRLNLRYQGSDSGPLFWAHYSFLGLNPNGLRDQYTDYLEEMKNYTLANRAYCIRNPKEYKGYGESCWGLTASYSVDGYAAHAPNENSDCGVITPTASLSSIVYTPEESMAVMRYLYETKNEVWGKFGFYDAFSQTHSWYPRRYLAIDQGTTAVMIENHRSGLLWDLFMSHPDVQNGLSKLGFEYPDN